MSFYCPCCGTAIIKPTATSTPKANEAVHHYECPSDDCNYHLAVLKWNNKPIEKYPHTFIRP